MGAGLYGESYLTLLKAAQELYPTEGVPTYVNDHLGFEAVHRMYARAIEIAESEGA